MEPAETFAERVLQRIRHLGLSEYEISRRVSGSQYMIRDIKKRGSIPRGDRLQRLSEALGTTTNWLLYGEDAPPPLAPQVSARARDYGQEPPVMGQTLDPRPVRNQSPLDLPKNVPVLGNAIGTAGDFSNGTPARMELIEMGEVVDMVRRPPGIADVKKAYALYIMGDSQSPRFEPGELVYVHPHRPVAPGDDVVVQLVDDGDCTNCALVKRLVRRTADTLILRQFNPAHDFEVPMQRVRAIHRILNFAELYGY